ncbi:cytochrome C assembly family protein [Anaeromyxobacter oryzae]|uniref:C-type cytochrome biogenesis protein CcsB n=1 Tax=Anaeromyxobacter oryzae TaxID=2918170 RepID=A0ABN6MQU3_9BACT|nr:cytochrome c biogenesis protein [Anaeromyxobacter oryzae]BDG01753.1 c-type cytochrome biogenesis protein CcsB [Anaeromyxobacter oryzae]
MSVMFLRAATALYLVAAAAYVIFFARPRHTRLATVGFWVLTGAFALHAVAIGVGCAEFGGQEFFSLRGGLVLMVFLAAGIYLFLQRWYHMPTVGAFITPLMLVVLIPVLFGDPGHPGVPPETLRNPSVTVHVMTMVLGVALFGVAFGVSVMYLLQEREVKGKHFGALFSRLPSLESLDRLNQRLVRSGFVFYTIGIIAGTLTAKVVWKSAWSWDPQQVVSLAVFLLYGAMVQLRHTGWHGRRYALLTLVGFVIVLGSMVTLKSVPGVTRHAGDYGATVRAGDAQ